MLSRLTRGGVPVLNRTISKPWSKRERVRRSLVFSPRGPDSKFTSPMWIRPHIGPGGQNNRRRKIPLPGRGDDPLDPAAFDQDL